MKWWITIGKCFSDVLISLSKLAAPGSCKAQPDDLREPSSQNLWFRVVLKQRSGDNVPTVPTMGSTPIFQPGPQGHNKLWISFLPKASVGFSHASTASMGIVFLPPQWPNQLWEHFLLLLRSFYSHPAQTLPGLNRGGWGEKRHMPSRPLRMHTKRKIKLLRHARMRTRTNERMTAFNTHSHTPHRGNKRNMWQKKGVVWH